MRLSHARLSIGGMMAIVAIVAVPLGLARRSADLRAMAALHDRPRPWYWKFSNPYDSDKEQYFDRAGRELTEVEVAKFKWHASLREKYQDASRRPWLPVGPDPPEPK